MALTVWTKPSGYSFVYSYVSNGNTLTSPYFPERKQIDIPLPVTNDLGVTYEVISGELPPGLRIQGNRILGTPYEVPRITTFLFCIRARLGSAFSDRSYKILIEGADAPKFITDEGNLQVGNASQLYALDSTFVDFQIEVFDSDLATGQHLTYYIAKDDGVLPPGLMLTEDGRIVGFIQPVLSIKPEDGDGTYDDSYYDSVAFDFAFRPTNGYDSFVYDNVFYDLSIAARGPRKLNRNYEFIVSVSDGDVTPTTTITTTGTGTSTVVNSTYTAKRKFKIFVVGDDYFRADNASWLDGSGLFTADVTYLRAPIWITPKKLGTYRANNYLTIPLETYERENTFYKLNPVNADIKAVTKQKLLSDNLIGTSTIAKATTANSNRITVNSTYGMIPGMQIVFSGTGFGNIVRDKIYYIKSVNNNASVGICQISQTGTTVTATTGTTVLATTVTYTSNTIIIDNPVGVEIGMNVIGSNIISGTTVVNVNAPAREITLSNNVGGAVTGVITFYKTIPHGFVSGQSIKVESTGIADSLGIITVTGLTTFTYTSTVVPVRTIVPLTFVPNAFATLSPQITIGEVQNSNVLLELTTATGLMDVAAGGRTLTIEQCFTTPVFGQYLNISSSEKVYQIYSVESLGNDQYRLGLTEQLEVSQPDEVDLYIGSISKLPEGMSFDTPTSQAFGIVPYQPAVTKTYDFTIIATRLSEKGEESTSPRKFSINIVGEIDSVITWNTLPNLGTINANFVSLLSVSATSTIPDASVLYRITSGSLPAGLSLNLDGEIVGKVNQYYNSSTSGLTTFSEYSGSTNKAGVVTFARQTFDGGTTTIDRVYSFTVEARDQYGYSATTRTFKITIDTPTELVFSNIRVQPFLKLSQRTSWKDFISNTSIFTPNSIYRPNDNNFGVQSLLSMIVYAGVETTQAAKYISAMGLNHKTKRFHFGSVEKATAYVSGTTTPVYEVVYVRMIDPLEPNGKRLPNQINLSLRPDPITVDSSNSVWSAGWPGDGTNNPGNADPVKKAKLELPAPESTRPEPIISVDSTGYRTSNPKTITYYPNSISIWRERFKTWKDGATTFAYERNYLPLWMRSIQAGEREELGFQLAVPICYCKVGTANDIMLNIKFSGFDFKTLDYTADRYIIDSVEGETGDKYLVFRNDRITV
jgi:hypothetical protein